MNDIMNKEEIMKILPHRDCMLLLDDVENFEGTSIGHYTVRGDEFFLKGHFPGQPTVPGVILCEIMAQSCALLMLDDLKGKITLYTGIDNVRFKSQVVPGDTIEVEATLTNKRANIYFCEAKATVNGKLCVKGSLSFALIEDTRKKDE